MVICESAAAHSSLFKGQRGVCLTSERTVGGSQDTVSLCCQKTGSPNGPSPGQVVSRSIHITLRSGDSWDSWDSWDLSRWCSSQHMNWAVEIQWFFALVSLPTINIYQHLSTTQQCWGVCLWCVVRDTNLVAWTWPGRAEYLKASLDGLLVQKGAQLIERVYRITTFERVLWLSTHGAN